MQREQTGVLTKAIYINLTFLRESFSSWTVHYHYYNKMCVTDILKSIFKQLAKETWVSLSNRSSARRSRKCLHLFSSPDTNPHSSFSHSVICSIKENKEFSMSKSIQINHNIIKRAATKAHQIAHCELYDPKTVRNK